MAKKNLTNIKTEFKNQIVNVYKKVHEVFNNNHPLLFDDCAGNNEIIEKQIKNIQRNIKDIESSNRAKNTRIGNIYRNNSKMFNDCSRAKRLGEVIPQEASNGNSPTGGIMNSVILHSGEFQWAENDFKIQGRKNMGMSIDRNYRSMRNYEGPFGYGWDHSYNQRIIYNDNVYVLYDGNYKITFYKTEDKYFSESGFYYELILLNNELKIIERNGVERVFEKSIFGNEYYRIKTIQDIHHLDGNDYLNKIEINYLSNSDFIDSITDSQNNTINFYYHTENIKSGLIKSIECNGYEVLYDYKLIGNYWVLTSIKLPSTPLSLDESNNHINDDITVNYYYNSLVSDKSEIPLLEIIQNSNEDIVCFNKYDIDIRSDSYRSVIRQYHKKLKSYNASFDYIRDLSDKLDLVENIERYKFLELIGNHNIYDPSEIKHYDWLNNKENLNSINIEVKSFFEGFNLLNDKDDARISQLINITSGLEFWTIDYKINKGEEYCLQVSVYTPDNDIADPNSCYKYVFDIINHKTSCVPSKVLKPGLHYPVKYEYNSNFEIVTLVDELGCIYEYRYDEHNNHICKRMNILSSKVGNTQNYILNKYTYEQTYGYVTKEEIYEKDNLMYVKLFEYDKRTFDIIKVVEGDKNIKEKTFAYNKYGQCTKEIDGEGIQINYEYYDLHISDSESDSGGGYLKFIKYGSSPSNRFYQTNYIEFNESAYVEGFCYDELGNICCKILDGKKKFYIYNIRRMCLLETDYCGTPIYYDYNKIGQKIKINELVSFKNFGEVQDLISDKINIKKEENYDYYFVANSLKELLSPDGRIDNRFRETELIYDINGNIICNIIKDFNNEAHIRKATKHEYYSNGMLKYKILPNKQIVLYKRYKNTEKLGSILLSTTYINSKNDSTLSIKTLEYNDHGLLITENNEGVKKNYEYDIFGRVIQENDVFGNRIKYEYDCLNQIRNKHCIPTDESGYNISVCERYLYNTIAQNIEYEKYSFTDNNKESDNKCKEKYIYDKSGRLYQIKHYRKNSSSHFYYDICGREIAKLDNNGNGTLKIYKGNNLIAVTNILLTELNGTYDYITKFYKYNGNGAIEKEIIANNSFEISESRFNINEYDISGRLISNTSFLGNSTKYHYDIFNNIICHISEDILPSSQRKTSKIVDCYYNELGVKIRDIQKYYSLKTSNKGIYLNQNEKIKVKEYDEYNRLVDENNDGIVKKYKYNDHNKIISIRTSNSRLKNSEVLIEIKYDLKQRPFELLVNGVVTQRLKYDMNDNVIIAEQHYSKEAGDEIPYLINTFRKYDFMGSIIEESFQIIIDSEKDQPEEKTLRYDYDYYEGHCVVSYPINMDKGDNFWSNKKINIDTDGKIKNINTDKSKITYSYKGNAVENRKYSRLEGKETVDINTYYKYDEYLQPNHILINQSNEEINFLKIGIINDKQTGFPIISNLKFNWRNVDKENNTEHEKLERMKFYKYDGFGQMVFNYNQDIDEDNSEMKVALEKVFNENLTDHYMMHLGSYLDYDECGNIYSIAKEDFTITFDNYKSKNTIIEKKGKSIHDKTATFYLNKDNGLSDCLQTIRGYDNNYYNFNYDDFGRLTYFNQIVKGKKGDEIVKWQYSYDVFNNLIQAKGKKEDNEECINIHYRYDYWGRRIFRYIIDNLTGINTFKYLSVYEGDKVVIDYEDSKHSGWQPFAEYLWGAGEHEILLSNLPNKKIRPEDEGWTSYWMFQDNSANVILSAYKNIKNQYNVLDIEDYINFGESNNKAKIDRIVTNIKSDPSFSIKDYKDMHQQYKDAVNPDLTKSWKLLPKEDGQIDIVLSKNYHISGIKLFASRFWCNFDVYPISIEELKNNNMLKMDEIIDLKEVSLESSKIEFKSVDRDPENIWEWIDIPLNKEAKVISIKGKQKKRLEIEYIEVDITRTKIHDFGFAGARYDEESNLYFNESRYRLPIMQSKFMTPDPIGYLSNDNLYAYGKNNPISMYDPDGKIATIAFAAIGLAAGAVIGGASYFAKAKLKNEEFDFNRFLIYAGVGAGAGALAGLTGGATLAYASTTLGLTTLQSSIFAGAVAGAVGGGLNTGGINGLEKFIETGNWKQSIVEGLKSGAVGAVAGAFGGAVSGGIIGKEGISLLSSIAAGTLGGASGGFVYGGLDTYSKSNDIGLALESSINGAFVGAFVGAVGGAISFGIASAGKNILPGIKSLDYPKELPKPKGLLIKSQITKDYGGYPVKTGYARHHITPNSLGGSNNPSNIVYVAEAIHRIAHPPPSIRFDPTGTIYILN